MKGGISRSTFTYNWSGDVTQSTENHVYNGVISTLVTDATYDRMGKKQTQEVTADGQTAAKAVNTYAYDDLNRLETKVHGSMLESIAYTIQGWVKSHNSPMFAHSITYNDNGNINRLVWTQYLRPTATYLLSYDAQNRLTAATENTHSESGITYDRNGNIKTLQRTADNAIKDDIAYQYNGNQLTSVTGNLASAYTYDNNGNLKTDSRKSLEFSYNYLNLLESAGETNYTYAADGTKLSVKEGSNGFDYLGSLILSANSTEFQFGDGIITKTTGGYDVTYHLRDHLGSVRSVVNKNGDVLQQSDYYPFGLKQERSDYVNNSNRFLYNGKELQTTGDLGVLDYGARMYDADLGRFFTPDRFLEKFSNLSQYQYAGNSPIMNIDMNGDSIWFSYKYDKKGNLKGVTLNYEAKIINMSGSSVNMSKAASKIKSQMESSFAGNIKFEGEDIAFNTNANITVANSMSDVNASDHIIALIDDFYYYGKEANGAANGTGGKVAFVSAGYFRGPFDNLVNMGGLLASHENGHLFGLDHSDKYINLMYPSAGEGLGVFYQTSLTSSQLKGILKASEKGRLNQGSNKESVWGKDYPNRGKFQAIINYFK